MGTIKRGFANNILTTGKFDATDLSGTIPSSNVANTTLSSITSVPASVGDLVQSVASDPSPAAAGDVWYNSTSGTFKSQVLVEGTFSSGGNLVTATNNGGGAGTQTAALYAGGNSGLPGDAGQSAATQKYDGSAWTTSGNLINGRRNTAGCGTQTAGLVAAGLVGAGSGSPSGVTEEFNGSTWAAGGTMANARVQLGMAGIQTASLGFGGYTNLAEEYDGSSWTAGGNMANSIAGSAGAGTQTAGLSVGGSDASPTPSGFTVITESYNGSTWTSLASLNTIRTSLMAWGTQTSAVASGGSDGATLTATELWNGTSWTTNSTGLATARFGLAAGSAGTQTTGIGMGGYTPGTGQRSSTEEWTGPTLTTKTVTTS